MSHDEIIGHCGGVGAEIGTLTITDNDTGEVRTVKKLSRGLAIFVYATGGMEHMQARKAERTIKNSQHRFYEAIQVGDEEIHYDASVEP